VYLDVKVEGKPLGRIVIALNDDVRVGAARFADLSEEKDGVGYRLSKFDGIFSVSALLFCLFVCEGVRIMPLCCPVTRCVRVRASAPACRTLRAHPRPDPAKRPRTSTHPPRDALNRRTSATRASSRCRTPPTARRASQAVTACRRSRRSWRPASAATTRPGWLASWCGRPRSGPSRCVCVCVPVMSVVVHSGAPSCQQE
jgi:hypothetical protein